LLTDTWEYDFGADLWTPKTIFQGTARQGAVWFSVNNQGYVATGRNVTLSFDDIYQFYPTQQQQ
jgi:hypothetical protein